jgi:DNA-binding NarL/FixJ family response regulator
LYDSFAQPESDHHEIGELVANPRARRVVVYTWNFHPDPIASARQHGAHGYLSTTLPARELVAALEAVHAGEVVVSDVLPRNADVARLTYLSPNTAKSYICTIYRKINAGSRTQAVLWGVKKGFTPDHNRIEHWRGGP